MKDFLQKYIDNSCSEEEFIQAVDSMVSPTHAKALNEHMESHWTKTTGEGEIPDLQANLFEIHYKINLSEKSKKRSLNFVHYFSRVAAILIFPLLIAFGYLVFENNKFETQFQTISCPLASHTNFELPDGSTVWLNAGSSISFPSRFSGNSREVHLEGQAFFDVKKGKIPFEVKTEQCKVSVLGTRFDVCAYGKEKASVTLESGSVAIETNKNVHEVLKPGQQAYINENTGEIETRSVQVDLYTSWKDNLLIFENEPFSSAILRLERWFNIRINVEDDAINAIQLTGTFRYESIDEVVDLLEIMNPVTHRYNKDKRTLTLMLK